MKTIRKKVGANVMPVVVTPEGEWLQDTSQIMDVLEQRCTEAPVIPATPQQRIAAWLLEAWGDEFWLAPAMHYRWNFDENFRAIFQPEGGRDLIPFAPRFVRDRLIERGARSIFTEFCAQLAATQTEVDKVLPSLAPGATFRRQLSTIEISYGIGRFRMAARPYSLWMLQRAQDAWRALIASERAQLRPWLRELGGEALLDDPVRPRLRRVALRVAPRD